MVGTLGLLGGIGTTELLVILGITVIIFGASRIPEIAKSLGKGIKEFKKATHDLSEDVEAPPPAEKKAEETKDEGKQ